MAKRATLKSFRLRLDVVLAPRRGLAVRPTVQHNAFEQDLKPPQVFNQPQLFQDLSVLLQKLATRQDFRRQRPTSYNQDLTDVTR